MSHEDDNIFSWTDATGKPICIEIAIVAKDTEKEQPCDT